MTDHEVPAGWHPDPANPSGGERWWDGRVWTEHTRPGAGSPAASGVSGAPATDLRWLVSPPPGSVAAPALEAGVPGYSPSQSPPRSFASRNSQSLIAIGVVAIYVFVALNAKVVFFGVLPVVLSINATRRREALAPLAIAAAVVAVGVAVVGLRGH